MDVKFIYSYSAYFGKAFNETNGDIKNYFQFTRKNIIYKDVYLLYTNNIPYIMFTGNNIDENPVINNEFFENNVLIIDTIENIKSIVSLDINNIKQTAVVINNIYTNLLKIHQNNLYVLFFDENNIFIDEYNNIYFSNYKKSYPAIFEKSDLGFGVKESILNDNQSDNEKNDFANFVELLYKIITKKNLPQNEKYLYLEDTNYINIIKPYLNMVYKETGINIEFESIIDYLLKK